MKVLISALAVLSWFVSVSDGRDCAAYSKCITCILGNPEAETSGVKRLRFRAAAADEGGSEGEEGGDGGEGGETGGDDGNEGGENGGAGGDDGNTGGDDGNTGGGDDGNTGGDDGNTGGGDDGNTGGDDGNTGGGDDGNTGGGDDGNTGGDDGNTGGDDGNTGGDDGNAGGDDGNTGGDEAKVMCDFDADTKKCAAIELTSAAKCSAEAVVSCAECLSGDTSNAFWFEYAPATKATGKEMGVCVSGTTAEAECKALEADNVKCLSKCAEVDSAAEVRVLVISAVVALGVSLAVFA